MVKKRAPFSLYLRGGEIKAPGLYPAAGKNAGLRLCLTVLALSAWRIKKNKKVFSALFLSSKEIYKSVSPTLKKNCVELPTCCILQNLAYTTI
jgi:hypothetical protein